MWPAGVVRNPPLVDDDLGFAQRVEDFAVQTFVAQAAVGAYIVGITQIVSILKEPPRRIPSRVRWLGSPVRTALD
jgi:hypothetical protein